MQEDQDDHHRRAPLVHAAHEEAQEHVVVDVLHGRVGLGRRRAVVHGEEDARHRLREEREHRGRAERVVPVGALRDLAVEEAAQERPAAGALVEPRDGRDRDLERRLLQPLAVRLALGLLGRLVGRRVRAAQRRGPAVAVRLAVRLLLVLALAAERSWKQFHVVGLEG